MTIQQRQRAIQDKMAFISCVVPVYNEQDTIEPFFTELANRLRDITHRFEIIAIDDGSCDASLARLKAMPKEYQIKIISFSRNFGKEIALTAGLDHVSGELAILMDADFQHPTEVLPLFIEQWQQGYDMVYGVRKNRDSESKLKRGLARLFYWIMSKITKIDIPNNAGDFRLIDKKVIVALNGFQERARFMKGLYAWVGYRHIAVPFETHQRYAGKSGWGFSQLTELAITGITSFSDVPLRIWGIVGFVISVFSLIYAIYIVTVTLLYGTDLPGFPSIIVAVMFLGGIQLLSVGILGEYIARIFAEVKQRPKYLIAEQHGFDSVGP